MATSDDIKFVKHELKALGYYDGDESNDQVDANLKTALRQALTEIGKVGDTDYNDYYGTAHRLGQPQDFQTKLIQKIDEKRNEKPLNLLSTDKPFDINLKAMTDYANGAPQVTAYGFGSNHVLDANAFLETLKGKGFSNGLLEKNHLKAFIEIYGNKSSIQRLLNTVPAIENAPAPAAPATSAKPPEKPKTSTPTKPNELSAEDKTKVAAIVKNLQARLEKPLPTTGVLNDATKKAILADFDRLNQLSTKNQLTPEQRYNSGVLNDTLTYLSSFNGVWPELSAKLAASQPPAQPAAAPPPAVTAAPTPPKEQPKPIFKPLSIARAQSLQTLFDSKPNSLASLLNNILSAYSGFGLNQFLPHYPTQIPQISLKDSMEQALKDPSVTEQQLKDKMAAIIDMPFQSHALREDYKEDLSRLIHTAFEGKANPAAAAQIFAHDFNVRMADLQSKSPLPALIETAANNFRDYKIDPSLASFKMPDGNINNVSAAYFDHNQGSSPNQKSLVFKADGAINGSVALVEKETNIFTVREITPTLQKLLNGAGFKEPPASISLETATVHADNRRIINHLLEMANDNVKFDSEIKAKAEQLGVKPDDVVQALDTYKLLKTNLSSSELNHGLPGGATDETGRHYVDNALTAPNLTTVAALQQADRDAQQLLEQARKQAAAPRPAAPAQTTAYDLRFEQRMKGQGDLYVTSGGVSGRPAPQIIQNANGKPIAAVYRNGAPGYEDCPPQGRPAIKHGFNQRVEALKHNTTWGVFAFSGHGVHKPKCPPCPEECYSGHDPRTGKPVEPVRKSPSVIQAAAPPSAKPGCAPDHDCVIRVDPQTLNNTAGVVITSQVPQTNDATGQPCNKNDNNPCVVFVDNARDMTTPKGVTMIPTQTTPTFAVRPN